jgi:hypothetical protein
MKHIWVRNTAFARLTGIRKVCMTCGAASPGTRDKEPCPGKRSEPDRG